MSFTPEQLHALHDTLYEILGAIDAVCKKHGIGYYLIGGSAIGAHYWEGIIPWDDDIDIGMLRRDYDRFLSIAQQELGDKYFLQTPETDRHVPFFFAKVRKNGTTYLEHTYRNISMHHGAYIDIMPFDSIPDSPRRQRIQYKALQTLTGIFTSYELWQYRHLGTCEIDCPLEQGILRCLATRIITTIVPKNIIYKVIRKVQIWYNDRGLTECKNISTKSEHLPLSDAQNTVLMPFGNMMAPVPRNVVQYLLNHYGKIQKDCPMEMRVNHCPDVFQLD